MGVRAAGCKPAPSAPSYRILLCCKAGLELRNPPASASQIARHGCAPSCLVQLLPGMLESQEAEDCDCSVFQAQGDPDQMGLSGVGREQVCFGRCV